MDACLHPSSDHRHCVIIPSSHVTLSGGLQKEEDNELVLVVEIRTQTDESFQTGESREQDQERDQNQGHEDDLEDSEELQDVERITSAPGLSKGKRTCRSTCPNLPSSPQ